MISVSVKLKSKMQKLSHFSFGTDYCHTLSPSAPGTGQCEKQDTNPHEMCFETKQLLCDCDGYSLASISSSSIGELEQFLYGNNDEDLCQECLGAGGEDGNDY